jgi:surface protein
LESSYKHYKATNFNQHLNQWNISQVTNMHFMFYDASNFNQPLNQWNVSQVTNMRWMFYGAINFNQPLNSWNISQVLNMNAMFSNSKLEKIYNITNLHIPHTHLYFNFKRRHTFVLAIKQIETIIYSKTYNIHNYNYQTCMIPEMMQEIGIFI